MMRVQLVGAVALTISSAMTTSGASAQISAEDSVVGTARQCTTSCDFPSRLFDVIEADARSGPSGETARGDVFVRTGRRDIVGQVTCLLVNGNIAVVGYAGIEFGVVDQPTAGLIRVVDGGAVSGQDTWAHVVTDQVDPFRPRPLRPADCAAFPAQGFVTLVAEEGNLTVTDGQRLPVAKDQCKNGGWRNFGDTFRNQGQCVAFVQRGPKP